MTKKKSSDVNQDRLVLPPSGLAEDILEMIGKSARGESPGAPAPTAQEPPPPEAPLLQPPVLAPSGLDRIYTFADSLEKEGRGAGEEAKEEVLETWVTFKLEAETFGLPVTHVQEIIRISNVTRVPHAPRPVRGVTNLRGRVLPIVDLRWRIGLQGRAPDERSRILVLATKGRLIGLLVDSVEQVVRLSREEIHLPPRDVMTAQSYYLLGVCQRGASLVILLDVDQVLLMEGPEWRGEAPHSRSGAAGRTG